MRIETTETKIGKFNEWPKDVQSKILDNLRHINVDMPFWNECTLDMLKQDLELMGFWEPDISYSGFWSQGDGASFTSSGFDLSQYVKTQADKSNLAPMWHDILPEPPRFPDVIDNHVKTTIYRCSYHYSHVNTCHLSMEYYDDGFPHVRQWIGEWQDTMEEFRRDICHKIYRLLEDEYEYMVSDKAIRETIDANEYEFDENGDIS